MNKSRILAAIGILAGGLVVALACLAGLQACTCTDPLAPLAATACAEQRDVALATMAAYRTQIPPLQTRIADVEQTAVVLETLCISVTSMTPTPTVVQRTSTPLYPTPATTPTPPPIVGMCQTCTEGGRECPAGYSCAYCPQLGYRCVDPASVNGSCNACRIASAAEFPTLTGLATWYTDSVYVATGEKFDPTRLTCAVDISLWPVLAGQTVRVTRLDSGACLDVAVNDCGYLERGGQFTYGMKHVGALDVARWWPSDVGYSVVVDLSPAAADILTHRETCAVTVEVVR